MTKPRSDGSGSCILDGEKIPYELRRSGRKTLGITVTPNGQLKVTAPEKSPVDQVERVLRRRASWIRRQIRETSALPPETPPREWVSGETHYYLGRQYRLRIRTSYPLGVRLVGRFFQIGVKERGNPEEVRQLMERWYLKHARSTFERRLQRIIETTPRLNLKKIPPLIVRRIRTRWGSCSAAGRILMNVDAVKLPSGCLDYVLMHELCHLKHADHGKAFWRHLDRCMPDWEHWRRRLDRIGA